MSLVITAGCKETSLDELPDAVAAVNFVETSLEVAAEGGVYAMNYTIENPLEHYRQLCHSYYNKLLNDRNNSIPNRNRHSTKQKKEDSALMPIPHSKIKIILLIWKI